MNIRAEQFKNNKHSQGGMTLIEILVTLMISVTLFTVVGMLSLSGARGILALTNYTEMDRRSKYALDIMSKDIRQAVFMTSFSSTSIAMTNKNNTAYSYTYNPTAKTLTRTWAGVSKVLLSECDSLTFNIYQKTPSAGFNFTLASSLIEAKLVDVNWKCSRQILGQKVNTESIQTAKIVMRN